MVITVTNLIGNFTLYVDTDEIVHVEEIELDEGECKCRQLLLKDGSFLYVREPLKYFPALAILPITSMKN